MATKRVHVELDPDYEDVTEQQTKRQRFLEEDAKEATRRKIENIIQSQFSLEIQNKEEEVADADQRLNQCRLVMDRLRACIIANFYSKAGQQKFSQVRQNPNEPPSIHPTVKEHIGKAPKNYSVSEQGCSGAVPSNGDNSHSCGLITVKKEPTEEFPSEAVKAGKADGIKLIDTTKVKVEPDSGRGSRFKMKKRIVVGNVSKYIPIDRREENDQSTHKWMVYVRGPKEEPNIDHYVRKVWFFLHPSYRPNDLVEVSQPPFHLTRRGWGEFPVRVQLHFKDQRNKRVDVIHQLKLDRTYTGLQTLGSETVVDIELEKEPVHEKASFDLKIQLKGSDLMKKGHVTIAEQQKQKLKDQTKLNGVTIKEVTTKFSVNTNKNGQSLVNRSSPNKLSSQTKSSPTKKPLVGKGSLKSPNKIIDEKRDNQKAQVSKGDNSGTNTAVILQSILSPKTTPVQQLSKADLSNNVVFGIVQPTKSGAQFVQPLTQTMNKANLQQVTQTTKQNLIISQSMVGNNSLILQPSTLDNKLNTMIIRPTLQKSQSNMLFIQSVPQVTSAVVTTPNAVIMNSALQPSLIKSTLQASQAATLVIPTITTATGQGKSFVNTVRPTVSSGKPQTVSALLQLSAAAQKQSSTQQQVVLQNSGKVNLAGNIRPSTPTLSSASQTLYYRCKDAHGNIFLVPQPALKQVLQSPSKPAKSDKPKTTTALSVSANVKSTSVSTLMVSPSQALSVTQALRPNVTASQASISSTKTGVNQPLKSSSSSVPIILNLNPTGQTHITTLTTTASNKSLLKSAVLGQEATITGTGQKPNSQSVQAFKTPSAMTTTTHKQTVSVTSIGDPISVNSSPSKSGTKLIPCVTSVTTATSVKPSTGQPLKSGTSLLFTMNSSNGKTVVMPAQSIFTSKIDNNSGKSLLSAGKQTVSPAISLSQTSVQNGQVQGNELNGSSSFPSTSNNVNGVTSAKVTSEIKTDVSIASSGLSATSNNSVTSMTTSKVSSHVTTQGQLKVTSQGLKVIGSTTVDKSSEESVKNVNVNSGKEMCSVLSSSVIGLKTTVPQLSTDRSVIKIDTSQNFNKKSNCVSLLSKEYQKPVISSNNPSSLLPKTNLSLLKSSSASASIEKNIHPQISGLGEKKIMLDLRSETERRLEACEPTKRIICLRKKCEPTRIMSPHSIAEAIKPLKADDYPDVLSLVRAAVKRHPLVSLTADKYQHPYCASTVEEWLSWKLGKRRASEWQRACFCRKFIRKHLDGDTYKGTKLWTTKHIMLWCRLHAFSPHYLESTLHPFGVELTADRIGKKFSSVTCQREIIPTDNCSESPVDVGDEEEIDIIGTEKAQKKSIEIMTEEKAEGDIDILPPSAAALYIQDTCQKIGVKFEPSEIDAGVHGSVPEDMIFSVMKSFIGDVLTEMFAGKISNGRYPDSLGMTDVFNALKNMSQSDFLTNCHLGVKTRDKTVHR